LTETFINSRFNRRHFERHNEIQEKEHAPDVERCAVRHFAPLERPEKPIAEHDPQGEIEHRENELRGHRVPLPGEIEAMRVRFQGRD